LLETKREIERLRKRNFRKIKVIGINSYFQSFHI